MCSFLEYWQITGIFMIRLYFWGLWFHLWIHWWPIPAGYLMALTGNQGNRDKISRHKLVRSKSMRTGRKQEASGVLVGSRKVIWRRKSAHFCGSNTLSAFWAMLCCSWSSSGESLKVDLGRSGGWIELGAISRATSISAHWCRSSKLST